MARMPRSVERLAGKPLAPNRPWPQAMKSYGVRSLVVNHNFAIYSINSKSKTWPWMDVVLQLFVDDAEAQRVARELE